MPTVVMGCARDIVEQAGAPRFFWSNFPLGHSAGKPQDRDSQRATLREALRLFDTATEPGITKVNPQAWSDNQQWQEDFMNIAKMSAAKLERLREEFAEQKRVANAKRADVGA